MRHFLILASLAFVTGAVADEGDFDFKGLVAKKALRDYKKAAAKDGKAMELKRKELDKEIANLAKTTRDAFVKNLKKALKQSMQAGNLEEANKINAAIKLVESKNPVATSDSNSPILYRFFEYDQKNDGFVVHTNVKNCVRLEHYESYRGKQHVLMTEPASEREPATFSKVVKLPHSGRYVLRMRVSHNIHNGINHDWVLVVRINDVPVMQQVVSAAIMVNGWADIEVDLQRYVGRMVKIDIINSAGGPESSWNGEHGYWTHADIIKK